MPAPDGAAERGPAGVGWHFVGATASKLAPALVQLALLLVVGRAGSLEDVGVLALASAIAFGCGSLAEAGFNTSLSAPEAYLHDDLPPLRATRGGRLLAAAGGSALYAILWAAGLGQHEPLLLILLPLPALLALSYGYAGVMNAAGQLRLEARVNMAESALVLALLGVLSVGVAALPAALLALLGGRIAGTLMRVLLVRGLPQSKVRSVPDVARTQGWFLATTAGSALHAQIDIAVLGFSGSFALLGVYAPLLRTAYASLLVAEGLAWALYGRRLQERVREARGGRRRSLEDRLLGSWRGVGVALGAACAGAFWLLGAPIVEFVLDRDVDGLRLPVTLLSATVLVRFCVFVLSVDIIRTGRQRARLPVDLAAAAVLAGGAAWGAGQDSLSILTLAKLVAELVVVAGYVRIVRAPGRPSASPRRTAHA